MARKPRIEFPGAFYHVMARGNRKQAIFKDDSDRERFLQKLLDYKHRYAFLLYAYTLMYNHIHLLIETGEVPLSRIMQGFLQSYTQWYNMKHHTVGHLFQGRYKAIICDKGVYLLNLVRYLHLNCKRAGLVDNPADYRWSSHRIYLGLEASELIDSNFVLAQFSQNYKQARHLYKEFIMEWISEGKKDEFFRVTDQRFLGDEKFVTETKAIAGERILRAEVIMKDKDFSAIVKKVRNLTGVSKTELCSRSRSRRLTEARSIFVLLCLLYTDYKRKDIAEYLGRVPRIVTFLENWLPEDNREEIIERVRW
jgi:putative transposase